MIDAEWRLWVATGSLRSGGPYTWHIIDFDQRRHFGVTYAPVAEVEDVEETEDVCLTQLRRHLDQLGPVVYGIRFTEPDGPVSFLTDQDADDQTTYINNYPLFALNLSFPVKAVFLADLKELDRLGPQVDLVSYPGTPCTTPGTTVAAFKYWFMENGMFRTWHELNDWSRLPRDHPHIVPFDSVVLDHNAGGIVGFTSRYIPGGTLRENNATKRRFCLRWLHQLLSVVDDLNYRYGIMHQDIAARNLVVDENNNLRIFDFNYAIRIGKDYNPARDDIKGVIFTLFEVVTLDEHFREVPHVEQDAEAVLRMTWEKHPDVQLDADLEVFQSTLDTWVAERKAKEFTPRDTWLDWPQMPTPPAVELPTYDKEGKVTGTKVKSVRVVERRDLVALNKQFWNWERPASYSLTEALAKKQAAEEETRAN
ncbi:hypothetical protein B0J18DRAFT_421650 [Chaetomium sp. MPI-SDFR-AT-0129]|nr:hypothetical protein B0J18DRAFT_421650 [Chaetomium sp. MPI-SDFR-AT-0129]